MEAQENINSPKKYALLFLKEFIEQKRDENIPLGETYLFYLEFMKERFPDKQLVTATLFHRMTTDYFYKKPGAKNYKAVSLEQMEKDLCQKQLAIHRDRELLKRIKKNRDELLSGVTSSQMTLCCHQIAA
jgi:hypothetical protein